PDDIGCNESGNTSFDTVLRGFMSRRKVLRGGVGTAATLLLTGGLAGCDDDDTQTAPPPAPPPQKTLSLNFNAVPHSLADTLVVPTGYTARVLYAFGDPLSASTPAFLNDGSETGVSFAFRSGDHHDGMEYLARKSVV